MSPFVVNETSLGFVGCSFEKDTCGWEEISVGQCRWVRGSNSSDFGPSTDNTLGTEEGKDSCSTPNLINRLYTVHSTWRNSILLFFDGASHKLI